MPLPDNTHRVAAVPTKPGRKAPIAEDQDGTAIEYRADMDSSDSRKVISQYTGDLPLIVTYRPDWEQDSGGYTVQAADNPEEAEENRIHDLCAAMEHADAVDAEAAIGENFLARDFEEMVLEKAEEEGIPVIASYHMKETPPEEEIHRILDKCAEMGDTAKLAVTAEDLNDAARLLQATYDTDHQVATMAMGSAGAHTRVLAPFYGSSITYGSLEGEATADGQLELGELVNRMEYWSRHLER